MTAHSPLLDPTSPEPRTRRKGGRLWLAAAVAVSLAIAAWVALPTRSTGNLAPQAQISASSTAVGSSATAVIDADGAASPGASWRADNQTVGAWVELDWSEPRALQRIELTGDVHGMPGITEWLVDFGNGSRLLAPTSSTSRTSVWTFRPRTVQRVRLIAAKVAPGANAATVAEVAVFPDSGSMPGPQDSTDSADVGPSATLTSSATSSVADPGSKPSITDGAGGWFELSWPIPQEIAAISLGARAGSPAVLTRGHITFDGGSDPLDIGGVTTSVTASSRIAFTPRVVSRIRLTADLIQGTGPLLFRAVTVLPANPSADSAQPPPTERQTVVARTQDRCDPVGAPTGSLRLVVACPSNASVVDDHIEIVAVVSTDVTGILTRLWSSAGTPAGPPVSRTTGQTGDSRGATIPIDLSGLPAGPVTVSLTATGPTGSAPPVLLQLRRPGPIDAASSTNTPTTGRTLVFAEEFDRSVTLSPDGIGSDYSSAKPTDTGPASFGSAILPTDPSRTMRVVDGMLQMDVIPIDSSETDPSGWGRRHVGALLSSARVGGSGFAAQYGYFEARIAAPAGVGTWPAFWMLPAANAAAPVPVVAEIDAVELYGHEPTGACQTTKQYPDADRSGVASCGQRFDSIEQAQRWHIWGADVRPDGVNFFLDGNLIAHHSPVGGLDAALFFLLDLQLGGGWPIDLGGTRDRATLWTDWIRVYV